MSILILDLFVGNFLGQLIDLLLLSIKLLLDTSFLVLLFNFDLILQMLNVSLEFVTLLLLDEDFLRWNDLVAEFFVFSVWILIMDVEDAENTILTSGEEILIIVRNSDSLDRETVSLNLVDLVELLIEHLD